jgi:acyl CoA:acetate/3-ketoacid CoA transferase beta subunit
MDLAAGARRVVVLTRLTAKDGSPKLVRRCTFPLTACGVVDRVITELGVFDPAGGHFRLVELAPQASVETVTGALGAPLLA